MVELQAFYLSRIEEAVAALDLAVVLQNVEPGRRGVLWLTSGESTRPLAALGFEFDAEEVRFAFTLTGPLAVAHAWAYPYRRGIEDLFPALLKAIQASRIEDKREAA